MNENDEIVIDLFQVWEAFKKVCVQCILITMACTIVMGFVTLFILPKEYTATAKLIVVQKQNGGGYIGFYFI